MSTVVAMTETEVGVGKETKRGWEGEREEGRKKKKEKEGEEEEERRRRLTQLFPLSQIMRTEAFRSAI